MVQIKRSSSMTSEEILPLSNVTTEPILRLNTMMRTVISNEVVTYQRSSHMTNVQKVKEPPLQLINRVPGLKLVEMERPHMCCGSGG